MNRFTLPRDIYYGAGSLEALKQLNGRRAMVCVGGESMKKQGFLDKAVGIFLGAEGVVDNYQFVIVSVIDCPHFEHGITLRMVWEEVSFGVCVLPTDKISVSVLPSVHRGGTRIQCHPVYVHFLNVLGNNDLNSGFAVIIPHFNLEAVEVVVVVCFL